MAEIEDLYNETQRKFYLIEDFLHNKIKELEESDFNWRNKKSPNHTRHEKLSKMVEQLQKNFNFMSKGCEFDANFQKDINTLSALMDEKQFKKIKTTINSMARGTGFRRREAMYDDKVSLIKSVESYFGRFQAHNGSIKGLDPKAKDFASSPVAVIESAYRDLSSLNAAVFKGIDPSQDKQSITLSAEGQQLVDKLQRRIDLGRKYEGRDKKKDAKTNEIAKKLPTIKEKLIEVEKATQSTFVINNIIMELKDKQKEVISSPNKKLNVSFDKAISMLEKALETNKKLIQKSQKQLEDISKLANNAEFESSNISLELSQEQDAIRVEEVKAFQAEQEANQTISPEAYALYDTYQLSGTGKSFENWCLEDKGLTQLPEGWGKVASERLAGMSEYQKQQATLANQKEADEDEMEM